MGRLVALGAAAIIGPLPAKALIVAPAIGAAAAAESALKDDAIAFFGMVNRRGVFAKFLDTAENSGIGYSRTSSLSGPSNVAPRTLAMIRPP